MSQCRISSKVTVSPIKVLFQMTMLQYRVIPQLLIHHNPSEEENWLCPSVGRHPNNPSSIRKLCLNIGHQLKNLSSMSRLYLTIDHITFENPSLIRGVCPSVNRHLDSSSIMLQEIISNQSRVLSMCELSSTMCEVMVSGWS